MNDLLRSMQIPPPCLRPGEVYCFTLDGKTEISFWQELPGAIDMVVHAATLANPKADGVLRKLLEMNQFAYAGPNISVGMNPRTGAVSLWSRVSLADMDVARLVDLIRLAEKRAVAVRCHLEKPHIPAGGGTARRKIQLQLPRFAR